MQPVVRILDRAFLIRCLRVAEPGVSADAVSQTLPSGELSAAIKGDRPTCIYGQGSEAVDQGHHDRFGCAIFIAHEDSVAADALDQRRHRYLSMLAAEHHQIAHPVTELGALRNAFGPVGQALRTKM